VNWRQFSACLSQDSALFFPDNQHAEKAIAICNDCPVQQECWEWADTHQVPHGVWGGEDGYSRRQRLQIDKAGRPLGLYPDNNEPNDLKGEE
jgi:WhiB family redox-sensing transcriptional regulator